MCSPLPPASCEILPPKPSPYDQLFLTSNTRRRRRLQRPPMISDDEDEEASRTCSRHPPRKRQISPGDLLVIALRQVPLDSANDARMSLSTSSASTEDHGPAVMAYLCTASSSFADHDDARIPTTRKRRTINFDASTSFPMASDCAEALSSGVGFGDWKRVYDIIEDDSSDDTSIHEDEKVSSLVGRYNCSSVDVITFHDTSPEPQEIGKQKCGAVIGGVYVAGKESARLRPLLSLTMCTIRDDCSCDSSPLLPLVTACAKRLMAGRVILRGSATVLNLPKVGVNSQRESSVLQIRLCAETVQPDERSHVTGSPGNAMGRSSHDEENEPYIVLPSTRITILNKSTAMLSNSNEARPAANNSNIYLPAAAKTLIEVIRCVRLFAAAMDGSSDFSAARFVTRTMLLSGPPGVGK